ncbi:MAG TPA: hypothetical protein VFK06_22330 [Candidatus Angelobacter sp.]|nr:hypothetical protein [Candidatus Angelobacter sp.]
MLERERAIENLKNARRTPRCVHIKPDGVQCGSPALKNCGYCFAHARLALRHPRSVAIPLLEDANSVQSAIMEVIRGLLDGDIDRRTAGLLLYALQMASCNLKYVCFEPKDRGQVVRDVSSLEEFCDVEEEAQAGVPVPHEHGAGGESQTHEHGRTTENVKAPEVPVIQKQGEEPGTQPWAAVPHEHGESRESRLDGHVTEVAAHWPREVCLNSVAERITAMTEIHRLGKAIAQAEIRGIDKTGT